MATTMLEDLNIDFFNGPNEGLSVPTTFIFPHRMIRAQTPFAVRYGLIGSVNFHEHRAACNPKMLSFFGYNDTMPAYLCDDLLNFVKVRIYIVNHVYKNQYPSFSFRVVQYLLSVGMDPLSNSMDLTTAVGWGNYLGARVVRYFKNDGWNSLGDPNQDYGKLFQDNTGYKPVNDPSLPEKKLKFPLRWQPLTHTDYVGNFFQQKHVTPNIGLTGKTILMPRKQLLKRRAKGPYRYPNRRVMHRSDRRKIMREARKTFSISSRLSKEKIKEAHFWDNKFLSTGWLSTVYLKRLIADGYVDVKDFLNTRVSFLLPEAIAMHDAMILAWHEKRRHDLARPQTLIRQIFGKKKRVRAFRGPGRGYGMVKAVEWEPLIPAQPHSEYPSGSAALCWANFEATELTIRDIMGKNATIPPIQYVAPLSGAPGSPFIDRLNFTFKSPRDMARRCAKSRLWAGVHFTPAIVDGARLTRGLGKMAHEYVKDLENGRIPKYCQHCQVPCK